MGGKKSIIWDVFLDMYVMVTTSRLVLNASNAPLDIGVQVETINIVIEKTSVKQVSILKEAHPHAQFAKRASILEQAHPHV